MTCPKCAGTVAREDDLFRCRDCGFVFEGSECDVCGEPHEWYALETCECGHLVCLDCHAGGLLERACRDCG